MTATDELRRLLDERGVEYTVVPEDAYTREYIKIGNIEILTNDRDEVAVYYLTPEQAVEATLGRGECRIAAATDELMDEKLASIGYVKVVRCGDCKHATPDTSGRKCYEGYLWCDELTEGMGFSVAPSDFCAWGERRDA